MPLKLILLTVRCFTKMPIRTCRPRRELAPATREMTIAISSPIDTWFALALYHDQALWLITDYIRNARFQAKQRFAALVLLPWRDDSLLSFQEHTLMRMPATH